jgi:hypothetical protein
MTNGKTIFLIFEKGKFDVSQTRPSKSGLSKSCPNNKKVLCIVKQDIK